MQEIFQNAEITKATLSLYNYSEGQVNSGNTRISVYELTSEWDQSAATWTKATSSKKWNKQGGDYKSTVVDQATYRPSNSGAWHEFTVTDVVKNLIASPTECHGLLLRIGSTQTEFLYRSTEASDKTKSPKLDVTYTGGTNIINQNFSSQNISYFMNPVLKEIHILLSNQRKMGVALFNMRGEKLKTQIQQYEHELVIPLKNVPTGMYLLKINSKGKQKQEVIKILFAQ